MIRALLSGLIALLSLKALAQPEPGYRLFTSDQGLASNEVYGAYQDSHGYMWFATDMGVSRYDGYEFENFDTQSGLSDNTTLSIFEDRLGKIWFLSISGKLSYYYKGSVKPYKYNDSITSNMRKGTLFVNGYVDRVGSIYLTGNIPGLIIGPNGRTSRPFLMNKTAAYLPASKTWVYSQPQFPGTPSKKSLFTYERRGVIFANVPFEAKQSSGASTFRSTEDEKYIYSTFADVCVKILKNGHSPQTYRAPRAILFIYKDHQQGLWLVLSQGGVLYFKDGDITREPQHFFKESAISSVFQDRNDSFWITTEKGVLSIPSINYQSLFSSNGLKPENVTTLVSNGTQVYAGAYDGEIIKFSDDGKILKSFASQNNFKASIYKLFLQGDTLWYTGRGTAGYIVHEQMNPIVKLQFSRDITSYPHGLLAGNFGSLYTIEKQKVNSFPAPDRISALLSYKDGILAGTISGLWYYSFTQKKWQQLNTISPDLNNSITDIVRCGEQIICATKGFGIFVLDTELRSPLQVSMSNGLSGNNIKELYPDGNHIWLSTDRGLNRIDLPVVKQRLNVLIRTTENGLASNRINSVTRMGSKLWVATDKGITIITDVEKSNKLRIPFFLHFAEVNGKKVDPDELASLSHRENNVTIHFESIPIQGAEGLRYRYRIKGSDKSWNYTTQRHVQYANLSPGHYEFQVGLAGADDSELENIQINISTPLWSRWWFIASLSLAITLLVGLIIRRRTIIAGKVKLQRELINQQITQLELKALRSQMNPHFLFNCMNSIQRFILSNDKHEAYTYMVKFSRLMRLVLDSADQDFVTLTSEIESLKLYLELEQLRFKSRFSYAINVDPGLSSTLQIPAMLIQPYVENSVWHGLMLKEEQPFLRVDIRIDGEFLIIIVEDNGVGREFAMRSMKEESHKSHGMKITHERLAAFSNKYKLSFDVKVTDLYEGEVAAGTRVEIRLPHLACSLQTTLYNAIKNLDH